MTSVDTVLYIPEDISEPMQMVPATEGLPDFQRLVRGYVEVVSMQRLVDLTNLVGEASRDNYLVMVVNEEGISMGFTHNLRAQYLSGYPAPHRIVGPAVLAWQGWSPNGKDLINMPERVHRGLEQIHPQVTQFVVNLLKKYDIPWEVAVTLSGVNRLIGTLPFPPTP